METGIVFDIKEFALFDGPGIRTTVFMKGCPLRCRWCHNPEGLEKEPQYLKTKEGGLRLCGTQWTVQSLCDRLKKGQAFFESSGGGVTFSGGEPLWQWPFVQQVIANLKGIHTAVETSGAVSDVVFKQAMATFDLMMMDMKSIDPDKHKAYTGVDNEQILRNAHMLCEGQTPFIIRLPLIPGVNDDEANMKAVAQFLKGSSHLIEVEMLPYHQTAGAKYEMAGIPYHPGFDTTKAVTAFTDPFIQMNIPVRVL